MIGDDLPGVAVFRPVEQFRNAVCAFVILMSSTIGVAADIEVSVSCNAAAYRTGDKMTIVLTYKNTSDKKIAFLPEPKALQANVATVTHLSTGERAEVVPFGNAGIDFEAWSRDVVPLHPNQQVSRRYQVSVVPALPEEYGISRRGIYLLFSGSSLKLSGTGRYRVQSLYRCRPSHPVRRYIKNLWTGEARSNEVIVEIK